MFEPIMGMEPSTIYSMLPINDRKVGVILDASVTNPDMARDFGEYPIEDLQVPTLIFHAKDDKLASYADTERAVARFPNCTFIPFESGGHLLTGHAEEIKEAVSDFVEDRSHLQNFFWHITGEWDRRLKMKWKDRIILNKLFIIASLGLIAAGVIFLCVSIFDRNETTTPLAIAVVCILLSNLFNVIRMNMYKK